MPTDMVLPAHLYQLSALCSSYGTSPKVIFAPRVQLGQAVETALARRTGSGAGLRCTTPLRYALALAQWDVAASGRSELPPAGLRFLAAALVEETGGARYAEGLSVPHRFARTVGRAIESLRQGGIAPERVTARAARPGAPAALEVVAACYERYHARLEGAALYDDADVMQWACRRIAEGQSPAVAETVYAVYDETPLTEQSYRLMQALRAHGRAFYHIGEQDAGDAPPLTAAALFAGAPCPVVEADGRDTDPPVRVRRAVGAESEVRGVFREILQQELPLDEVEIACAGTEPYLSLTADLAEQMGLAVSLGTGLPALQTKTGQALRGFYEWIQEDFDAKVLIRLLRAGLVRVDRVLSRADEGQVMAAHEVATHLAQRCYEPGRQGWRKAFAVAAEDLREAIRGVEARGAEADRERDALCTLRNVQRLVEALLNLVPRRVTVQGLARASQHFLERFGPVDAAHEKEETERTLEEAARGVLYRKLGHLAQLPFTYEASPRRLAGVLKEVIVAGQYVRSQRPRPGAAHVVPLESAGYAAREHLFVVGLGSNTVSSPALDDALLPGADRTARAAGLEIDVLENQDEVDTRHWCIGRALQRHRGPVTLYASVFDIESGEERFPASLFLEAEAARQAPAPLVGLLPDGDALSIDERDDWLAAFADGRQAAAPQDRTVRALLDERYAWLRAGEAARAACASEAYTGHDGLLAAGAYPELDFTDPGYDGPSMSARRLETLAETPYLYFLKYVLGVEPLDEPALEEGPWLDPLRRGNLLHRTFERFLKDLDGTPAALTHEEALFDCLDAALAAETRRVAAPSERVEAAARRRLQSDARVFLQAEVEAAASAAPLHLEIGFGYGPRREREGDLGAAVLALPGGGQLSLCGRIDRVDEVEEDALAIWDYKTGSAKGFSQDDPLGGGATLQWALYAYVLGALTGRTVCTSGYSFATTKEMGFRLHVEPEPYREEVEALIGRLAEMARCGCFPMTPKARDANGWTWNGYDRLFTDLAERSHQLKAKQNAYPEDRPPALFL